MADADIDIIIRATLANSKELEAEFKQLEERLERDINIKVQLDKTTRDATNKQLSTINKKIRFMRNGGKAHNIKLSLDKRTFTGVESGLDRVALKLAALRDEVNVRVRADIDEKSFDDADRKIDELNNKRRPLGAVIEFDADKIQKSFNAALEQQTFSVDLITVIPKTLRIDLSKLTAIEIADSKAFEARIAKEVREAVARGVALADLSDFKIFIDLDVTDIGVKGITAEAIEAQVKAELKTALVENKFDIGRATLEFNSVSVTGLTKARVDAEIRKRLNALFGTDGRVSAFDFDIRAVIQPDVVNLRERVAAAVEAGDVRDGLSFDIPINPSVNDDILALAATEALGELKAILASVPEGELPTIRIIARIDRTDLSAAIERASRDNTKKLDLTANVKIDDSTLEKEIERINRLRNEILLTPKVRRPELRNDLSDLRKEIAANKEIYDVDIPVNFDPQVAELIADLQELETAIREELGPINIDARISISDTDTILAGSRAANLFITGASAVFKTTPENGEVISRFKVDPRIDNDSFASSELRLNQLTRDRRVNIVTDIRRALKDFVTFQNVSLTALRSIAIAFGVIEVVGLAAFGAISAATAIFAANVEEAANSSSVLFTANTDVSQSIGSANDVTNDFIETNRELRGEIIKNAKVFSEDYPKSIKEIAEGYFFLAGAGFSAQEATETLPVFLDFATASSLKLEEGVEQLTAVTRSFFTAQVENAAEYGRSVDDINDSLKDQFETTSDLITQAAIRGITTVEELTKAVNNGIAGSFEQAEIGGEEALEQAVTLLAVFSDVGVRGLKAGEQTQILTREISRRFIENAEAARAFLGFDPFIGQGQDRQLRDFTTLIDVLAVKLRDLTPEKKQDVLIEKLGFTFKSSKALNVILGRVERLNKEYEELLGRELTVTDVLTRDLGALQREREIIARQAPRSTRLIAEATKDSINAQTRLIVNGVQRILLDGFFGTGVFLGATSPATIITDLFEDINAEIRAGGGVIISQFSNLGFEFQDLVARFFLSFDEFVRGGSAARVFEEIIESINNTVKAAQIFANSFRQSLNLGPETGILELFAIGLKEITEVIVEIADDVGDLFGKIARFIRDNEEQIAGLIKVWLSLFAVVTGLRFAFLPLTSLFSGRGPLNALLEGIIQAGVSVEVTQRVIKALGKDTENTVTPLQKLFAALNNIGKADPKLAERVVDTEKLTRALRNDAILAITEGDVNSARRLLELTALRNNAQTSLDDTISRLAKTSLAIRDIDIRFADSQRTLAIFVEEIKRFEDAISGAFTRDVLPKAPFDDAALAAQLDDIKNLQRDVANLPTERARLLAIEARLVSLLDTQQIRLTRITNQLKEIDNIERIRVNRALKAEFLRLGLGDEFAKLLAEAAGPQNFFEKIVLDSKNLAKNTQSGLKAFGAVLSTSVAKPLEAVTKPLDALAGRDGAIGRITQTTIKGITSTSSASNRALGLVQKAVKLNIRDTTNGFKFINNAFKTGSKFAGRFISALAGVFNIVVVIVGAFKGFFDAFRDGIGESESDLKGIKIVFDIIIETIDLVVKALFRIGEIIGRVLGTLVASVFRSFGIIANFIKDVFQEGPVEAVKNAAAAIGDLIRDLAVNLIRSLALPFVKFFNELNDIPGVGSVLDKIGLGKDDVDGFIENLEGWNKEVKESTEKTITAVGEQTKAFEEFLQKNAETQEDTSKILQDIADANEGLAASREEILLAEIRLAKDLETVLKNTNVTNQESIAARQKAFSDYAEAIAGTQVVTQETEDKLDAILAGQIIKLERDKARFEQAILSSDRAASSLTGLVRAGDPDALDALQAIVDKNLVARDQLAETTKLLEEAEAQQESTLTNNLDLRVRIREETDEALKQARNASRFGIQGQLNLAVDQLNKTLARRTIQDSLRDISTLLNNLGPEAKTSLADATVAFNEVNKGSLLDTKEELGALNTLLGEIATSEAGIRIQQGFGINLSGLVDKANGDLGATKQLLFELGKTEVGAALLEELGLTFDEILAISGKTADDSARSWVATWDKRLNAPDTANIFNRFFEQDQDTIRNIEESADAAIQTAGSALSASRQQAIEDLKEFEDILPRSIDLVNTNVSDLPQDLKDLVFALPQESIDQIFDLQRIVRDTDKALPKIIRETRAEAARQIEESGAAELPFRITLPKDLATTLGTAINQNADSPEVQRGLTEFAANLQVALDEKLIEGVTDISIANDGTITAITTDGTILGQEAAEATATAYTTTLQSRLQQTFDEADINTPFDFLRVSLGFLDEETALADNVLGDPRDELLDRLEANVETIDSAGKLLGKSADTLATTLDSSITDITTALTVTFPNAVGTAKETVDKTAEAVRTQSVANKNKVIGSGRSIGDWFADGAESSVPKASAAGKKIVDSLRVGMIAGFGNPNAAAQSASDPTKAKTVADMIHSIDDWIVLNKGPVSHDSQILVPAGQAIMQGFQSGLSDGFGEIQSWVSTIGPYFASDAIPSEIKRKVTADFLIGNVKDDAGTSAEVALAGLLPTIVGEYAGALDPSLGFLHKTHSAADTLEMAQHLAKLYDLTVTDFLRPPGTLTTSGNVSDHTFGTAADFSNGNKPTPQMDALFSATSPLLGTIFKQILYKTLVGGNHFNHVHLAWLRAAGFDQNSGKKGYRDYPGASPDVDRAIDIAARQTGVNPNLIAAVAAAESTFNPRAVSPAGAQGLMQLVPGTAARFGVSDPFNPVQSALGGAKYLKFLKEKFNNYLPLVLAGYNAGENNAAQALLSFQETKEYIKRVQAFAKQFGGFREHGGPIQPGNSYIVGERGPELITVPTRAGSGEVISNDRVDRLIAALERLPEDPGTSSSRPINITTNATDPEAVAAIIAARERSITRGIRR